MRPGPHLEVALDSALISRSPLARQVYEAIKLAVVTGELIPGEEVSEVSLARILGVSRTPVREAIRRLEAEGFVSRRDERLIVPPLSRRECLDFYAIRTALEGLAAQQAAENATPEDVEALREANRHIVETYARPDQHSEIVAAGASFHQQLALSSKNAKNAELIRNLMDHVARYRKVGAVEGQRIYLDDHNAIVEAVAAADPEAARRAMEEHVEHALELVIARFDDQETEPQR